ncbi:MAG: hypothetical protein MUP71_12455 [Candidatus Aminicenantes bacterium]|nr:hypothetical protein [Candidatus Aminicenantes bacterium]
MNLICIRYRIIVIAAIFLIMFFMQLPLQASRERMGATVVVTMTDGRVVKGELLSVRDDALLLYIQSSDRGERLELMQVEKVKLLKKSKFLLGLGIGLLVGLALSEYSYGIAGNDEELSGLIYFVLPPQTGLLGGICGVLAGISRVVYLAGESTASMQKNLGWLKLHAREQDPNQPPWRIWQRFHLLWSPSRQNISTNNDFQGESGTFRFVDDAISTDTAIYPSQLNSYLHEHVRADRFRLEYELTPHFSPSLEFAASGKLNNYVYLDINYFSTDYGNRYQSYKSISFQYSYISLLLGLNWKPVSPSAAGKHLVELGIAAGPARVNLNSQSYLSSTPLSEFKKLTWSCNVHVAYDYSWTRNISLGAFIGYQYLRASFPGVTWFTERQEFGPEGQNNSSAIRFTRRTEFTVPGHRIQLDGKNFGFRVELRF